MYLVCLFYVALFLSEINYLLVTTVKPVYNNHLGTKFLQSLLTGGRYKEGLCIITAKTVNSHIWSLYK